MIRYAEYPYGQIVSQIQKGSSGTFEGFKVKLSSMRLLCFQRSPVCVECGVAGTVFVLEKASKKDFSPHLNLYHVNQNGKYILMTKDHIVPASKGGATSLENLQTMCCRCNARKGDCYMDAEIAGRIVRVIHGEFEKGRRDVTIWRVLNQKESPIKVTSADLIGVIRFLTTPTESCTREKEIQ